ncbi:membrane protein [Corynebacterium phocae]|uniref:Membrane protein n=1 Tax=Corynebacterium phocae TaxID=161895 RepID=A0A1L7D3M9_9CORY|nr:hypothetical protein [Corynebacterium phocae]APT92734.1 membrane protein [Corynebacterium phocae]
MGMIDIKKPQHVSTATVVALGLVGGWTTAKETGVRPLGGAILAAAGVWAGRSWLAKTDVPTTAALTGIYLGAFGVSHPLAKKIGAWPSVVAVTAATAGASYALADSK